MLRRLPQRRERRLGHLRLVGARGREEQTKTLKRKEERGPDSTGEKHTVEQAVLSPVPVTPGWDGPRVSRECSVPTVGLMHQRLALMVRPACLTSRWREAAPGGRQGTLGQGNKLRLPGPLHSAQVEGTELARRVVVGITHWLGMMTFQVIRRGAGEWDWTSHSGNLLLLFHPF